MKERVVIMDAKEEEREKNIEKFASILVSRDKTLSMDEARKIIRESLDQ